MGTSQKRVAVKDPREKVWAPMLEQSKIEDGRDLASAMVLQELGTAALTHHEHSLVSAEH